MSLRDQINRLIEKRVNAVTQAREVSDRYASGAAMSAEDSQTFDRAMEDVDKYGADIQRLEGLERRELELATVQQPVAGRRDQPGRGDGRHEGDPSQLTEQQRIWQAAGVPVATAETRSGMRSFILGGIPAMRENERRALQADLDTAGGFIRPDQEFVNSLIKGVDNLVFVRRRATVRQVTSAESLGVPTLDADPDDADWTAELQTGSEDQSMSFGKRELRPHPLAKRIRVSNKLLRVSTMDVAALVRERLEYKVSVPQERAYMTGSGANQPLGIFTVSANGINTDRDVQTGSATDFTADGLINAKYFMKPQYWANMRWTFHRDAIRNIRKLKDSQQQYLWQPGLAGGQPDVILDTPFDVSEYVPNTFTTGLYVGALCDWRYYWIVEALTFQLQRLVELYATSNQTGFIVRAEIDGAPTLPEAFARLKTN